MSSDEEFHAWLRTQFSTLEEAKAFVRRWWHHSQQLPGDEGARWDGEHGYTMRAMAAHVSLALEGREDTEESFLTDYLKTKHGATLYYAMTDPLPPAH